MLIDFLLFSLWPIEALEVDAAVEVFFEEFDAHLEAFDFGLELGEEEAVGFLFAGTAG